MNAFLAGMAVGGLCLAAAFAYGLFDWRHTRGKVVAIGAGVLLIGLAVWTAVVLILSASARGGAPL
jgi:cytochrome c biogenesis protein CcdA